MKKYFLWEADTLRHWGIPAYVWDTLTKRQKMALSYLKESFNYRHNDKIKFLQITPDREIFFEEGSMSRPILPPSLSGKILLHALRLQTDKEPALVRINEKEGEEIYKAQKAYERKLVHAITKSMPDRSFAAYAPTN